MLRDEIIDWIETICPWASTMTEEEMLQAYDIYCQYRDEGQSHEVSKQYAGLI